MKQKALLLLTLLWCIANISKAQKIFDIHLHGDVNPADQMEQLKAVGVYQVAISTSWNLQQTYQSSKDLKVLQGIMLACPDGKVPYSEAYCFPDKKEFPPVKWVEQLIKENKIQFIGEVLSQYYGISPSDERLYPYYALAEKYNLPVGIYTGLAGPGHGAKNFKVSLGTPMLLEDLLQKFPKLKIWIMHAGAPFVDETIAIMKYYQNAYADISAINNKYIFPEADFFAIMKKLVDAGLEDRLMLDQITQTLINL